MSDARKTIKLIAARGEIADLKTKLDEISHILESEYQKTVPSHKGPQEIIVNNDAYYALEGVLQDVKHAGGHCDEVCIRTLQDVQMRIAEVMRITREYRTDNKESKADDPVEETRSDGASGD